MVLLPHLSVGFYRYYFPVAIKGFDREILEILSQDNSESNHPIYN